MLRGSSLAFPLASLLPLLLSCGPGGAGGDGRPPSRADPAQIDYCALPSLSEPDRERLATTLEDRKNTPPEVRANVALTLAGHDIAAASDSERRCRRAFQDGAKRFQRELRRQRRKVDGGVRAGAIRRPPCHGPRSSAP
jgi:hypothetical protein